MAPRYDIPKSAPPVLRTVQELVNTSDPKHGRELLGDPGALASWLRTHGLDPGPGVSALAVERVHGLRNGLRALMAANNGAPLASGLIESLNELAARGALSVRFDSSGNASMRPSEGGVSGAIAAILASVVQASGDGTWRRLKACPQCGWAFYDYSRNRSAVWCSMQICGNRRKTRAYRARRSGGVR